jgi:Xaa-Pro aminopeptidase
VIARTEFKRRRRQLMAMAKHPAAIIVPAAPARARSHDAFYPYRQDSDLAYLTGFAEADAVLVMIPGRAAGEVILFCRERDEERERWDGELLGPERAPAALGVDDAFPIEDIDDILPNLIDARERIYYHFGRDAEFDLRVLGWINRLRAQVSRGANPPESIIALGHLLNELRLFKSTAELKLLRQAAAISALAHQRVMLTTKPGINESQIEAELLHCFHSNQAVSAYEPMVASGKNACVLHYRANRSKLNAGELLLVDAGAEVQCYASDITRTIPISGRFNAAQKALYEVVLAAQLAAIDCARTGRIWNDIHDAAVAVIAEGLVSLKLIKGPVSRAIQLGHYKRYFMHKTGHWIGLDVHDVGDYRIDGQSRLLEPGMVLTVEPGVYIPYSDTDAPAAFRGMGIRIEDEIAISRSEPEVLTAAVPKTIADIEALMSTGAARAA